MTTKRKRKQQEAIAAAPASKRQQKESKAPKKEKPTAVTKAPEPVVPLDASPFLDNPNGPDLRREVELYNLLASEDPSERLAAATAIVSGILGGDGVQESTLQKHLERRLFRGLASGRKGARLGYSVVLAELMEQLLGAKNLSGTKYPSLTFEKVLSLLVEKTKPEGDLSGQEEKDHYLGLLFGLKSFVRSKILFADDERWWVILDKLFELCEKKPWVREECGWIILEALSQMNQTQVEKSLKKLQKVGLAASPEGVGIWLTARNSFPDMKFPSKPWGHSGNPLQHLKTLAKALKESSSDEDATTNKKGEADARKMNPTGNWNPQLHFVWGLVMDKFVEKSEDADEEGLADFENFWKVAVDESVFSASASRERKFWGFLLFQKMFQEHAKYEKLLPAVFSRNLVRCIINHVQDEDRFLNRSADKSLKVVVQAAQANPELLKVILPGLISGHGSYNFDKITKTKTIESLLKLVDEESAVSIIETLAKPAFSVEGTENVHEAEIRRQLLGEHIMGLVNRFVINDESRNIAWVNEAAVPLMAAIAYCEDARFDPPPSPKTRKLYQDRLMTLFSHFLASLSGSNIPCDLAMVLNPDAVRMDEEVTEAKDRALSTMKKICKKVEKVDPEDQAPLRSLALMYALVIFQLYNGEPDAISVFDELKLCYDKLVRRKDKDDSDMDISAVLVELLLSFLAKPSALLRKVSQHVFGAFMGDITAEGLQLMTDVLETQESLRGQQELFDQAPENEEPEEDEDEEMDSDVEVVDMNGEVGHLHNHLNKSDDESDDESDDDVEEIEDLEDVQNDEEVKRLNAALAEALGTKVLVDGEDSDSDADMTDSEMMALDSKLVEIFSQRKKTPNKKQEQKDAKETVTNFKIRVLDLLDLYVKNQANNTLAFDLLLPLLKLIRSTKNKNLASSATSIILNFAKSAKKAGAPKDVDIETDINILKAIHEEAGKDNSKVFAKAVSTASLLIASTLYKTDKTTVRRVAEVYMESQIRVAEGGKIVNSVFVDWCNWCQNRTNS
ncbi:hypothetical protein HYFRA_00011144 [Hymenoscyphus fraxineus]|uniref:DNA polymerase V n=1 Tax=Hymenoscyphus fraxineus TaxID=746836 RepID=A0A9N9KYH3_9HELO|nr:hypothetical protein HYFRA_00011144 [Hymenoscyphus fraxineus]